MKDFTKKSAAASVMAALEGIPEDLKYIFVPMSAEELAQFEKNVVKFYMRAKDRYNVVCLQKKYGLPIRPNMSWHRTMIFVRLIELKRKKNDPPSFDKPSQAE